jgi:glucans biosynthesis protein C
LSYRRPKGKDIQAIQGFPTMSRSSLALSNLRAFVILIVLAFHSVLAYLGSMPAASPAPFDSPPYQWQSIPIVDDQRWFGFDIFCAFQDVYLMTFMFFLSGLFVWPSLRRKGTGTFVRDRLVRLGVPFVVAVTVLMPITLYPVYRLTAVDPSWSAFWQHWRALPIWPSGPQWFLWELLVLNLAAAALYQLAPRGGEWLSRLAAMAGGHPVRSFLALATASAVAYVPLAILFSPWEWTQFGPFGFQLSRPLHYGVYFFAGVGLGAYGIERGLLDADGLLARHWAKWLAAAGAGFLAWILPTAASVHHWTKDVPGLPVVADFGFVISCATACFFFAAVFLRFATRRSRILDSLSENAYGMYLVHYVFVVWLQYLLLGLALFAVAKASIVFSLTLILSWAATAAMRRVPLGARLMGTERAGRLAADRVLAKVP